MKTKKSIRTEQTIINAAETLFMRQSVDKVTIADITKLAGVAKGTFYLYFDSKDALVWDFTRRKLSAMLAPVAALEACGFAREDICAVIDQLIAYVRQNEPLIQMLHQVRFYEYLGKRNMEKRYIDTMAAPLCRWMRRGVRAGLLEIEDPEFMARFLTLSVHTMFDQVIMNDLPFTLEALGEHLKSLLVKLLLKR